MTKKNLKITATPEQEDFLGKYESSGKVAKKLVDGYFTAVNQLIDVAEKKGKFNKALEIGCGAGYSTKRLTEKLPETTTVEASEYVPDLVKMAKKKNPGIDIKQEDIYELKRKNSSYDLVFLLEVLEHLDYPDVALAEIKRVLKPGGFLILGVPREPMWRVLNTARGKYWKDFGNTPGHLNHWSSGNLKKYLNKHVGEVVAVRKPLPWTICLAKSKK